MQFFVFAAYFLIQRTWSMVLDQSMELKIGGIWQRESQLTKALSFIRSIILLGTKPPNKTQTQNLLMMAEFQKKNPFSERSVQATDCFCVIFCTAKYCIYRIFLEHPYDVDGKNGKFHQLTHTVASKCIFVVCLWFF